MSSAQPENGFNIKRFIEEVIAEMKKVTWSSKKELISYTCVVAIAVAIVCSLIWVCDTIFARLFHIILR
jgi:preprotein translocase subunit SecE